MRLLRLGLRHLQLLTAWNASAWIPVIMLLEIQAMERGQLEILDTRVNGLELSSQLPAM